MSTESLRTISKSIAIDRPERVFYRPQNEVGTFKKVTDYYGENVFDFHKSKNIPQEVIKELDEVSKSGKLLSKEHADIIAKAVTNWAISKGATHFCHWFQPLTGSTAEKHDAFLDFDFSTEIPTPIEKLSSSQLRQGEPDASSFPNGGVRCTFEARGYTAWDMTSPMFLMEGVNGLTLCIPTAFVSYHGDALDIKTPLLRSVTKLNAAATEFSKLSGLDKTSNVQVTCGAEQEYFLVDKALYFSRPDLVMTGRTLFGSKAHKNQQLDDHYFGAIPERVLSFMEELDYELHRLGIPAKTRHNEVAPGQFELAQIFREANVAADNNQLVMAVIENVANRHDFKALLHEKPIAGINGSGKHLNWSMATNEGVNLLEPGEEVHTNARFLAVTSIVTEAVHRREKLLRTAISGAGNDHRLGANEAPPSIISVFLGDTIGGIVESIVEGKAFNPQGKITLDLGAEQLTHLPKDNTDRNRTSPFAFTGNKFEFRAVGSSQPIGLPMSILNAAVSEVFEESNALLKADLDAGDNIDTALMKLAKKWFTSAKKSIFNGDGYSENWVQEAAARGLANLKNTATALEVLTDKKETEFLSKQGILSEVELDMRYNVLVENYCTLREIEFETLLSLIHKNIVPVAIQYKKELSDVITSQKNIGFDSTVELDIFKALNLSSESMYENARNLKNMLEALPSDPQEKANRIANELFPLSERIADYVNEIEEIVPDRMWELPTIYDLLYLR